MLLLLVLAALDFGRVYLGWVNLQQMTRVAASFAADNALDLARRPGHAMNQMLDERVAADQLRPVGSDDVGCRSTAPTSVSGRHVTVKIDCEFALITPIISQILGTSITASASTTYPIRGRDRRQRPGRWRAGYTRPRSRLHRVTASGCGPLR